MNKTWHIRADGVVDVCRAKKGKCPYNEHFTDKQKAQEYADKINENYLNSEDGYEEYQIGVEDDTNFIEYGKAIQKYGKDLSNVNLSTFYKLPKKLQQDAIDLQVEDLVDDVDNLIQNDVILQSMKAELQLTDRKLSNKHYQIFNDVYNELKKKHSILPKIHERRYKNIAKQKADEFLLTNEAKELKKKILELKLKSDLRDEELRQLKEDILYFNENGYNNE